MNLTLNDLRDDALAARVQRRIDGKTKPLGALGRIEELALRLALIQGRDAPMLAAPQLVVFAADHGIAARGVSAYPQAVTAQMVMNMLAGGAAVSVLARQHGLALTVVDCGVCFDFMPQAGLVVAKAALGTADCTERPAMTRLECETAVDQGARIVDRLPGNALLLGAMGIGNTSAAALLIARLTDSPIDQCVGRGTGLHDAGLARKLDVLRRALDHHM